MQALEGPKDPLRVLLLEADPVVGDREFAQSQAAIELRRFLEYAATDRDHRWYAFGTKLQAIRDQVLKRLPDLRRIAFDPGQISTRPSDCSIVICRSETTSLAITPTSIGTNGRALLVTRE